MKEPVKGFGLTADFLFTLLLRSIFYSVLLVFFVIAGKIIYTGSAVISAEFLTGAPAEALSAGGIGPAIGGTFAVAILMILMAAPLGVGAAVYLSEYARNSIWYSVVRASVNVLASIPPVVLGLFGVSFFLLTVGKGIDTVLETGTLFGQPALLWAAATLAVLVLPIIITTSLDALQSVNDVHRTTAIALGATRRQVIRSVVLPQAGSGIITGILLAISRGIGETAPVLFLGCAFSLPALPSAQLTLFGLSIPMVNPFDSFMFLTVHLYTLMTQSANPVAALPAQYGTMLVLIIVTVSLNILAVVFRTRFRRITGSNR